MSDAIFMLPLIVAGPAIVIVLCLFALGGLAVVRRHVLPRLRVHIEDAEFGGAMVASIMVFYGLAMALIAMNVFETYSDVSRIASREATALGALYRDVSGYPEPVRGRLQGELRAYTYQVIHEAWPLQRRGMIPEGGVERMNRFQAVLVAVEPVTESQKLLFAETLRAYNVMIEARRLRIDAVDVRLPGVMWIVIVVGAFISLSATFFFKVDDARLHAIQVVLLALFIGLIIFMIFAFDRPFMGDLGVPATPYQLIHDQLMTP